MLNAACIGLLLAYFLHFALPALRAGFGEDEMMNLYSYWSPGAFKSIRENFCFWSMSYPLRPAGALYYLPLYHFFSLNPFPYRLVQISLLAATIPIWFHLAQSLSGSRAVGFLVALAMSYHQELAYLAFVGSFIYDVLCGLFYVAALTYYLRIRQKGLALRPAQLVIFLSLYVCALNSKEMAVSLPVIVLLYEVLEYSRIHAWRQFAWRDCSVAVPALIGGLITAIFIYAKLHSPYSLTHLDAYRPVYSWQRFTLSNASFIHDLLYHSMSHLGRTVLIAWPMVLLYAFWRRDRLLQLMAFWVVITPLPLAFIPGRGGAMLYIVSFGWAMIIARGLEDLIGFVGKLLALANPKRAVLRTVTTAAAAVALAVLTQWQSHRFNRARGLEGSGKKSLHVIQALCSLNLHPVSGSSILLEPKARFYQNGWYPKFVASLVWNDRSLRVYVAGQNQLTPEQTAKMNYVISFNEFSVQLVRPAESNHS